MHSKWLISLQIFVKVLDIKRRASSCTFEMATILNFTNQENTVAQFFLLTYCYQSEHNPKKTFRPVSNLSIIQVWLRDKLTY